MFGTVPVVGDTALRPKVKKQVCGPQRARRNCGRTFRWGGGSAMSQGPPLFSRGGFERGSRAGRARSRPLQMLSQDIQVLKDMLAALVDA